jgi:hypothetical protein
LRLNLRSNDSKYTKCFFWMRRMIISSVGEFHDIPHMFLGSDLNVCVRNGKFHLHCWSFTLRRFIDVGTSAFAQLLQVEISFRSLSVKVKILPWICRSSSNLRLECFGQLQNRTMR